MAGHSKWANIKFRKGVQDAKRGKIFTKLIREITVSARMGGGDESSNPRLRDAVKKALNANMKRDTIDNAIKRGVGGLDGQDMVAMRYEGYGPGGVAVLVDCLSDNKNRTVSEVRHAFTKHGGNLGTDGSVAYLFTNQGEILVAAGQSEDQVMEVAIEAGASDVLVEDGQVEVITPVENYHSVLNALQDAGLEVEQSQLTMRAQTLVSISEDTAESLVKMIDMLEDLDDVQEVYSNADFSEDLLESMN
ncbi:YebC/PmpR family DNA-binding transcriptional regulator [Legionella waltersii]|uniref:Probable transcriptional regulatory protein Lwal_0869 n=1 Tax=Legionella waltersii TaxID=66969 RepID=A0A0W1AMG9_9GAMM|nr:YebC/PmpR family DNA-binding transcriptional regulator [Legionella waltersii]KTD82392.1 YebC [Legionella waltersii]SNV03563.1 YebC [Legionella waltersii]